ncbi:MAG: ATP synthase subunit I [Terriglobales bacterium]
MNEHEHSRPPDEIPPAENRDHPMHDDHIHEDHIEENRININYERIIPRVLRNMLVASVLLLAPEFWFYRWAGSIGFAFGAAVSYVNFRSLTRGVEGLADRIVNRNSREKGGRIILRFLVRYGLVAAAAYAIFKGSSLAFRGFLWGLCVPVAALMAEAVWEGYMAFRRLE